MRFTKACDPAKRSELQGPPIKILRRSGHRGQELSVGLVLGQATDEQLHRFDGGERAQHLPQDPDAAEFLWRKQELVFTRAGALNVDCGEDALVGEAAVEVDFHVTGALELFE